MGEESVVGICVPPLLRTERSAVAAASHITFAPRELLSLIQDHLNAAGLQQTAAMLAKEANLADSASAMPGNASVARPLLF